MRIAHRDNYETVIPSSVGQLPVPDSTERTQSYSVLIILPHRAKKGNRFAENSSNFKFGFVGMLVYVKMRTHCVRPNGMGVAWL